MLGKTIAAVSTPYGKGGVALIRISGEDAVSIAARIFTPKSGKALCEYPSRYAVYGDIISDGVIIDDGLAYIYKAPASYTGEDTVEICCHGGILLTNKVLEAAIIAGAQYAEPGEFTQRAFLNGKIALTEAEAVINLIDAQSDEQIKLAASHRKGVLSKKADEIYSRILSLLSSTYAYIDYPDEDLTDVPVDELKSRLTDINNELLSLEKSYKTGKAVSEGIKTVIIGKPNAGKSSLLNLILGSERAIVTDIAGTTRDIIEESVKLEHIMLRIADTAGIRNTDDTVEKIGVKRAYEKLDESELIIAVFDGSSALEDEDHEIIDKIKNDHAGKCVIAVINKTDIGTDESVHTEIKKAFENTLCLCAKNDHAGRESLFALAESFFMNGDIDYDTNAVIANSRQFAAVRAARECVERAVGAIDNGFTQDIAGMDLEQALSHIGELDSRSVGEDIVSDIFSRFCIGK
ncbi:MAG: tRNA uridine-5-carboxymethylaminomethyl(34) synthesis GTPase MnmE [Clostridia bacterium]|nr:tRNA uridine-5-carboxymethylaminomethyl(34) synthesis GTPase MnmE [Clostridia bacterium]